MSWSVIKEVNNKAQKICLNVISSMVMVKMGRVKNGMMNKMVPTNEKLRLRKKNLINFIN